ncbi:MAG: hypothetical protein JST68_04765 [Bacteroidetes bacterium]|nr:hypothetical protein [Bacteroidota bacterium]
MAIAAFISIGHQTSRVIFDDAYISFRYAHNLATHGQLTWNIDGELTQGYSNFLLVIIMAAGIRLSANPLVVARVVSYMSLLAIGYAFYRCLWLRWRFPPRVSILLFILFIFFSQAIPLANTGMESILSGALIAWFILLLTQFQQEPEYRILVRLCLISFLSFLTRPENGLLIIPLCLLAFQGRKGLPLKSAAKAILLFWLLPVIAFLCWELYYYGSILPLPFYVKVLNATTHSGIEAFLYTIASHKLLFVCAALGSWLSLRKKEGWNWTLMLIIIFLLFGVYLSTADLLMNIYNRFFFPFLIIPLLLTAPLVKWVLQGNQVVAALVFLFLLIPVALPYRGHPTYDSHELMTREKQFAIQLGKYDDIKNISIAFGDAGVIPYYTGASFIDLSGLNNNTIAKSTKDKALNYLFGSKPTLLIGASVDGNWINFGHGKLGDFSSWMTDARMNDYKYVGTVQTDYYNLELLLRKDYPDFKKLSEHLVRSSDTVYPFSRLFH